jgi:hypothetical protein
MENVTMNSLATKLAFSALVVATLATPAFAQRLSRQAQSQDYYNSQVEHYPNGAARTGTADSYQSGAMFNQGE